MKTSYKKIMGYMNAAGQFLQRESVRTGQTPPPRTRFSYAIERVTAQLIGVGDKYNDELSRIEINNCLTSEPEGKGKILYEADGKTPQFDRPGLLECSNKKIAKANEDLFEFEPYFATALPDGLVESELIYFTGFVISQEQADGYREKVIADLEKSTTTDAAPTVDRAGAGAE